MATVFEARFTQAAREAVAAGILAAATAIAAPT